MVGQLGFLPLFSWAGGPGWVPPGLRHRPCLPQAPIRTVTPLPSWEPAPEPGSWGHRRAPLPCRLLLQGQCPGPREPLAQELQTWLSPGSATPGPGERGAGLPLIVKGMGGSAQPVSCLARGKAGRKAPSAMGSCGGQHWALLALGLVAACPACVPGPEAARGTSSQRPAKGPRGVGGRGVARGRRPLCMGPSGHVPGRCLRAPGTRGPQRPGAGLPTALCRGGNHRPSLWWALCRS